MFSDDEQDSVVASLGVDYMFGSQSLRGAIGAAYLFENTYLELSGGYDFMSGGFDIGLGLGAADTREEDEDDDDDNRRTSTPSPDEPEPSDETASTEESASFDEPA